MRGSTALPLTGHDGEPAQAAQDRGLPHTAVDDVALEAVHERMVAATTFAGDVAELGVWLRYHMGWADLDGNPTASRSAKDLRPRLCLAACRAVGGDPLLAVSAAAAVELTHEFSLIHDDIEDGDRTRRGRPTLWTMVGVAQAINAGDALFAAARGELGNMGASHDTLQIIQRRYDEATLALAQGQFMDLLLEGQTESSPAAYVEMAARKTGALLGLAASLGALSAGATEAADPLYEYGRQLGIGFQIADDVLGMWGDPVHTGKPAGADLARGKKSYPVMLALQDRDLAAVVRNGLSGSAASISDTLAQLESAGVRAQSEQAASAHAAAAVRQLDELSLAGDGRSVLTALARSAAERTT